MRAKLLLPIFLFVFLGSIFADDIPVDSKLTNVTVFRSGAQVSRTANLDIPKGESTIVFQGITNRLDQQSIQLQGLGNFTILSIGYRQNFINYIEKTDGYKKLEDAKNSLLEKIEDKNIQLTVFAEEESLILTNKNISGKDGLTVSAMTQMADFYRKRLLDVKKNKVKLSREIKEMNKDLAKLNQQLEELRGQNNAKTGEVIVEVSADNPVAAKFILSYLVYNAGWNTTYDIRVTNINSPLELLSKGMVSQSTGEDWSDINIVLSTGNPRMSTSIPVLSPWRLDFFYDNYYSEVGKYKKDMAMVQNRRVSASDDLMEMEAAAPIVVEASENLTTMEFEIKQKVSIPSDGKQHTLKLESNKIDALYKYVCIPKLDKHAYLKALLPDWQKYNLSQGEASLYFEGKYLGKSYINTAIAEDTMSISLGMDIGIAVKREKIDKYSSRKVLSSKVREKVAWKITVLNAKPGKIDLMVYDQVPVSANSKISVDIGEISGGKYDENTGIIEWEFELNPGVSRSVTLSYEVKYPKGQKIKLE